jgi:hypothetical protein
MPERIIHIIVTLLGMISFRHRLTFYAIVLVPKSD